ncbi:hypothetical protein C8Q77DRAFT_1201737 [Trametes polyzona]|nr:hypothetical protein C8Q77DRAFT_1201737 [Trametes polyzona]
MRAKSSYPCLPYIMKSIRPASRRYAVIRMDPVAMVKHFHDPLTTAAAQAIHPQKYLVYLQLPKGLPDPTEPWYEFSVDFIGTTLRAEDKERGLTADMVIPIYPNTSHPNNRPPVRSHPTFPFSNCYHWFDTERTVRIRRRPMWYDDNHAFKLDIDQHYEMQSMFDDDCGRVGEFLASKAALTSNDAVPSASSDSLPDDYSPADSPSYSHSERHSIVDAVDNANSLREGPWDPEGLAGSSSDLSLQPESVAESENSLLAIHDMDIFGLNVSSDTVELMPLVDMWLELTEHLTSETIGNPVDFFKEHDAIMR